MSIFCRKKLLPPIRVCLRLKKAREAQNLDLESLEQTTHIAKKYLLAIEECRFEDLPKARSHRVAYLHTYALALGLNPDSVQQQFFEENGLEDIKGGHPAVELKVSKIPSFTFLMRNIAVAVFIFLFAGYLVWQVRGIIEPPQLSVFTPVEGYVADSINTLVQGETEKECRLTINGLEARVNDQGKFEAVVDLTAGVNTITVSATKKHGKTTTEVRHVVVKNNIGHELSLQK